MIYINARFLTQPLTGVQRYAFELCRALDELVEPGVVTALAPAGPAMPVEWKHIALRQGGRLTGNLWEQVDLPRLCAGQPLFSPANIGPWLYTPQAVTIHDASVFAHPRAYTLPFRWKYRLTFQRMAKIADVIFTVSEFSKSELVKYLRIPAERIAVVPEGREQMLRLEPDAGVIARNNLDRLPFLLAVGSGSPHKNIEGLFEALRLLNPQDFEVVIVGGSLEHVFNRSGAESTTPACVRRLGYVSDTELAALYRRAAALVMPSMYEGFGLPVLEAMTCGCPVICARAGGLPEVGGEAALYFDPNRPEEMAEKIRQVMSSEELRAQMRRMGDLRSQKFSWKDTAARVWETLQERLV